MLLTYSYCVKIEECSNGVYLQSSLQRQELEKSGGLQNYKLFCYQTWTVTKTCIKEHLHFSMELLFRVRVIWI